MPVQGGPEREGEGGRQQLDLCTSAITVDNILTISILNVNNSNEENN